MTRLTLNFIETSIKWHFKTAKGGRINSYHLFFMPHMETPLATGEPTGSR